MRGGVGLVACVLLAGACTSPSAQSGPSSSTPAAAPLPPLDSTPVTIRVAHTPSTLYAPLYLALDRGYFDRLNVRVALRAIQPGESPVTLLETGQVDVAFTDLGTQVFNGMGRGMKLHVAGSMGVTPLDGSAPLALEVARPLLDSGQVKTLADLKGRKIVIEGGAGGAGGYLADTVLEQAGIGLRDVTVIDLATADAEQAIETGGVAAGFSAEPFTSQAARDGIAAPVGVPAPGLATSAALYGPRFGGSPAQRFFDALVRGARDVQGTGKASDGNLQVLARYTGQTVEVLRGVPLYDWDANLAPDAETITAMQSTYRGLGLLTYPRDLPASALVDPTYTRYAARAVR